MQRSLILPLFLMLSGCGDSPEESLAKAQTAFAANDLNAARLHLVSALAERPDDRTLLLLQARTLIALGDGDGAGTALTRLSGGKAPSGELTELTAEAALLRRVPDAALAALAGASGPEAERLRALAALQKGNPAAALGHFEAGLAAGGNPRLFADLARFRLMSNDLDGAAAMADRATKAAPDGIDSLLVSGQIAVRKGDLKRALALFERAEQRYPASLAALTGKAAVLGELGQDKAMRATLDKAASFAPRDQTVLFLRARAAVAATDWQGLRSLIQPIEAKLDRTDPLRAFYGQALLRLGQNELAVTQLEPIVRALPGNRETALLLAEAQLASGDARAAMAALRPVADQPWARGEELALMARAAKAAGDPAAARYEARSRQPQAQALGRDLADADAAIRAANWAGAVRSYERILSATDGRNVVVLNNMAYAQLMLGNGPAAREYADRALKLAPNNASVLDTAGWVRIKTGSDLENARRLLRQGAQQAPGNLTIRAHLAEAERTGR